MRLRTIGCGLGVVLASGLAGCAVHPLPQDVSYASTVQIVSRIRCEAKGGLEEALAKAAALGSASRRHAEKIVESTSIGFEFTFRMAENNRAAGGKLELERELAKAGESFKLELDADVNASHDGTTNTRSNTRFFRIVDDLKELRDARCGRRTREATPNLLHPISGSTGMAEVVRTYLELEMLTDLQLGRKVNNNKMVTFTDRLDFTTTMAAGASADIELDTPAGSLRLTRASLTGTAFRKDAHSVQVVLARDNRDVDVPDVVRDVRDKGLQTFLTQTKALSRNNILIELSRQRRADEDRAVAERVLGQPVP